MKLTRAGQIQKGFIVEYEYKGELISSTVKEVLNHGCDNEEVIIDLDKNKYFITSMAINGDSWAKNVNYFVEGSFFDCLSNM